MPRKRIHAPLRVQINGRLVGSLTKEAGGAIEFRYAGEWLSARHAFPVSLSLPLREDAFRGRPVVAVFENLLPDSDALRRRVAEKVGAEGTDAYSLLAQIGRDCVGALQFLLIMLLIMMRILGRVIHRASKAILSPTKKSEAFCAISFRPPWA